LCSIELTAIEPPKLVRLLELTTPKDLEAETHAINKSISDFNWRRAVFKFVLIGELVSEPTRTCPDPGS
jgi:hypothetical protein